MNEAEDIISGYSKYTNTEGIPEQYKYYNIFVKTGMEKEKITCKFGLETVGAPSNVAEIFPVSISNNEKYIGKVIPYNVTPNLKKGIINEIQIQNKAVLSGCKVPEIVMYFLGECNAVIVMDKIDGDTINSKLINIMENAKEHKEEITEVKTKILTIYRNVTSCLDTLHNANIYHSDSHLENFMYETKDADKIWIIDFGHASTNSSTDSIKILEDYICLRSAFTILSKSKNRDKSGKFILKGYSIYLEDIITTLNTQILQLENNVSSQCQKTPPVTLSMRRSKRQTSKRQTSNRKISKRQKSKRNVSKRNVSKRQNSRKKTSRKVSKRQKSKRNISKRQKSKRNVSKRSRR